MMIKKGDKATNYTFIYDCQHPFRNKEGFVREHRVVMENWLRRNNPTNINLIEINGLLYLKPTSIVHHINRLKYDNRVENLQVFERSGLHTVLHNSERKKSDIPRKYSDSIKHTLPLISLGKSKLKLLRYMSDNPEERLNIKKYSRQIGTPRSSIYYMLEVLQKEGFVEKEDYGCFKITPKGITYIEITAGDAKGVGVLRKECRKDQLSTHYLKFTLKITEKKSYFEEKLKELNPLKINKLNLRNLEQHYLYFEDATIIINPKGIIVRVTDMVTEDTEEANFKAFNIAVDYFERLGKIGLKGDTMVLEPSHYARIDSLLGEFLEKIDKRYFLNLGNGRKFWIDHSKPSKIEDETNDAQARERLDKAMKDIMNTDINLLDIDKIVNALGFMTKIEAARMQRDIKPIDAEKEKLSKELPSYFG